MKKSLRKSSAWAALALGLLSLLFSCASGVNLEKMTDEELLAAGQKEWNEGIAEDARPYWSAIRVPEVRDRYLAAFDQRVAIEDMVVKAAALDPQRDAEGERAFDAIVSEFKKFPEGLRLPADLAPRLVPLAEGISAKRVKDLRFASARSWIGKAEAFLGPLSNSAALQAEMTAYEKVAALETRADRNAQAAEATADFNDRISAMEKSFTEFRSVEDSATAEIRAINAPGNSVLSSQLVRIRGKRSNVRVAIERQLRARQYSFKERIGEIFARQPPANKIGNMTPYEILAFNEAIRRDIKAALDEMVAFGTTYPTVLDKDAIADVQTQAAALDRRIAQIAQEVQRVREIESRGKAALPLMIGLFNPTADSTAQQQKSRPAILQGTMTADADYWWGMVSIDRGALNDLVVTMKDGREVQVYADNTLSGTAIESKNLKNLVSRANRVGNSWPVMNAGSVLPREQYYIRLGKGSSATYSGEVVIYSSFIARVR